MGVICALFLLEPKTTLISLSYYMLLYVHTIKSKNLYISYHSFDTSIITLDMQDE